MKIPQSPVENRSRMFFLRKYMQKPMAVGAVAPSSQKLAQMMVDQLAAQPNDLVIELGPGTGVFTQMLLNSGVLPENLVLVEFDPEFVGYLREEFPGVTVIEGDARNLAALLSSFAVRPVLRVLSGIPLRSMKSEVRAAIAAAIAGVLKPGGTLVQFSYLNGSPINRKICNAIGLIGQRAGVTVGNMPPAFVWKYVKLA
jgi:phosphatidylethanolamine/phosphatidyl-N-methylethanolamine N-methyltransferase